MAGRLQLGLGLMVGALCLAGSARASEVAVPQMTGGQAGSAMAQVASMKSLMRDLATLGPSASTGSTQLSGNQAHLFQQGKNNTATIAQAGFGNAALLVQVGQGNTATVTQIGQR